jgi:hypothetical protein
MNFINWIKQTFEDVKGVPSSKRVTGFWITLLFTISSLTFDYIVWQLLSGSYPYQTDTLQVLDALFKFAILQTLFILLLFGIVTFESITALIKGNKSTVIINNDKPETEPTTPV